MPNLVEYTFLHVLICIINLIESKKYEYTHILYYITILKIINNLIKGDRDFFALLNTY